MLEKEEKKYSRKVEGKKTLNKQTKTQQTKKITKIRSPQKKKANKNTEKTRSVESGV